MRKTLEMFKLLSDESRLRILLLLTKKELCVCQVMGVLNMSQPLISRNISLLLKAGFLDNRREGKLMFYSARKRLPKKHQLFLSLLNDLLADDRAIQNDLNALRDCTEFQKQTGKCNMETLKAFMLYRRKRAKGSKK
jgi:ArsR family transcriptional regulator